MNNTSEGTIAFHADNLPPVELTWYNACDTISQVKEFEAACGATLYPLGAVPPVEKLKLRLSLELEELYEKAEAMGLEGSFQSMLFDKLQESNCIGLDCDTTYSSVSPDYSIGFVPDDDTGIYNPTGLLDACCDQRYVQDGTVLTCGLQEAFYEGFANVHASNMSKFVKDLAEAQDTALAYIEQGVDTLCSAHMFDGPEAYPAVVRRCHDGKILKSINYTPADLAPIIQKYTS